MTSPLLSEALATPEHGETMTTRSLEPEGDGRPSGDAGLAASCERVLDALRRLMESDPAGWPEHLAALAGIACDQDCEHLDLLADASVQVAARAHKRRYDRSRAST